jgi:hypothetical protein
VCCVTFAGWVLLCLLGRLNCVRPLLAVTAQHSMDSRWWRMCRWCAPAPWCHSLAQWAAVGACAARLHTCYSHYLACMAAFTHNQRSFQPSAEHILTPSAKLPPWIAVQGAIAPACIDGGCGQRSLSECVSCSDDVDVGLISWVCFCSQASLRGQCVCATPLGSACMHQWWLWPAELTRACVLFRQC